MLSVLQYIMPPIIGGVIGWSTNRLAIWMLFNPKREKRVFGLRIPFTPGLIPRDQAEIARSLGAMVEEKLINTEDIDSSISQGKIDKKIKELMGRTIEKNAGRLAFLVPETAVHKMEQFIVPKVTALIKEELLGFIDLIDFRKIVEEKVRDFPLDELEDSIKEVTEKHLTYITLFGGVLGSAIGLIQVVVNICL